MDKRKYIVYIGSKKYYYDKVADLCDIDLTPTFLELVKESDECRQRKESFEDYADILLIPNDNYNGITEQAHDRIGAIIKELTTNDAVIYIHNPPIVLKEYLKSISLENVRYYNEEYRMNKNERDFVENMSSISKQIIGQNPAIVNIGQSMWYLTKTNRQKPYVIMLYGNSSLGKTELVRKVAEKGLQLDMIQTYFSSISWVAFQIFQVFCLAFTAYIAWKGIIGVGDITLYQTYFSSIVAQIASIVTLLPIIAKGLESVESIGDVLCANDIEDNLRKKKIVDLKGGITFQDVSFTYKGDEKPVLSHVNFKIQPGETVAFAGGSGSGKTTILNLAIGFLKADSGQVLVDGNDLMELDLHSYRKQIAVVPQQSILFTGTLRENITYGSESISEEQLWNVIRAANLEEVVQKLPDGLDTMITEHGENLSGGQRQRISIARAFLRNPKILILDEATSALDSISEKKIQDSIQKLVKGRTTLIVAHRLSTIRNADRIAVIEKGNVLECGSYEELIEKKGAFYRMEKM